MGKFKPVIFGQIHAAGDTMRVDNDGEGGILALMALLGVKRQRRPAIVALGLFGAALISDLLISDGCDWSGVIAKLFAKSMRPARKAG
jgi:K+ potassium transporter